MTGITAAIKGHTLEKQRDEIRFNNRKNWKLHMWESQHALTGGEVI